MGKKAKIRLLQRAKDSPGGWTRKRLDQLYKAYGFEIDTDHKEHDIAKHSRLPKNEKGTLTRSSGLIHPDYIRHAVKLIEKVLDLEKGE